MKKPDSDWFGTLIFYDGILDGMLARDGEMYLVTVVDNWWKEDYDDEREYEVRPLTLEQADRIMSEYEDQNDTVLAFITSFMKDTKPVEMVTERYLRSFTEVADW